ncbi:hypothetical protein GLOIN_2v1782827 [Rhizophagus irregularis DAOM 181602=DAOM 197198]|nr:hypothetical protein GLOIN_2v1782827 [Rhizophagus irregularis DAOM 181602=DAOM 197198]
MYWRSKVYPSHIGVNLPLHLPERISFLHGMLPSFHEILPFLFSSPEYRKYNCCRKPECSIMCSGNLQGITKKELEIWLKSATTISFVHIIKQIHNSYGHIHFNTSLEAGSFFSRYSKDFTMDGLQNIAIRISVSYYFITRRKVDYLE